MNVFQIFKILLLSLFLALSIFAQEEPMLGDESDGSRAIPVHVLKLYDEHEGVIRPDDQPLLPYSTRYTCGECHNYDKITEGWHFNAGLDSIAEGRRGQPWIYVDWTTATQIPLTMRDWPGTFKPADVGMSALDFVSHFGRHMPGGSVGENETHHDVENAMRWMVSGALEANCMSCHDAEAAHDQAEYAKQTVKQNFRWAVAATSGFAKVEGSARSMPDNYDIYYGTDPDNAKAIPPSVTYDETRFNEKNEVFFDVVRKVSNERCYYCHSTKTVQPEQERWEAEDDVHLAAGMMCVDCHRNGLDHQMIRGFEGEAELTNEPARAAFTCEGCHIPNEDGSAPLVGRLGAPIPAHDGIPTIHFEKMSCTSCHTGSWPEDNAPRVKTSRAHALGTHGVDKSDEAMPDIYAPVFVRGSDGKIAPHKLFWPSFWGTVVLGGDGKVSPMPTETVRPVIDRILADRAAVATALADSIARADSIATAIADSLAALDSLATAIDTTEVEELAVTPDESETVPINKPVWSQLDEAMIQEVLGELTKLDSTTIPVFINAGKLYRVSLRNQLLTDAHPAAKAYSWAIGHDVRPAAQSLGVRGCNDCHSPDAPIYFGDVPVSPTFANNATNKSMTAFNDTGALYSRIFAMSFYVRPIFKWLMIAITIILSGVILIFVGRMLSQLIDRMEKD